MIKKTFFLFYLLVISCGPPIEKMQLCPDYKINIQSTTQTYTPNCEGNLKRTTSIYHYKLNFGLSNPTNKNITNLTLTLLDNKKSPVCSYSNINVKKQDRTDSLFLNVERFLNKEDSLYLEINRKKKKIIRAMSLKDFGKFILVDSSDEPLFSTIGIWKIKCEDQKLFKDIKARDTLCICLDVQAENAPLEKGYLKFTSSNQEIVCIDSILYLDKTVINANATKFSCKYSIRKKTKDLREARFKLEVFDSISKCLIKTFEGKFF